MMNPVISKNDWRRAPDSEAESCERTLFATITVTGEKNVQSRFNPICRIIVSKPIEVMIFMHSFSILFLGSISFLSIWLMGKFPKDAFFILLLISIFSGAFSFYSLWKMMENMSKWIKDNGVIVAQFDQSQILRTDDRLENSYFISWSDVSRIHITKNLTLQKLNPRTNQFEPSSYGPQIIIHIDLKESFISKNRRKSQFSLKDGSLINLLDVPTQDTERLYAKLTDLCRRLSTIAPHRSVSVDQSDRQEHFTRGEWA